MLDYNPGRSIFGISTSSSPMTFTPAGAHYAGQALSVTYSQVAPSPPAVEADSIAVADDECDDEVAPDRLAHFFDHATFAYLCGNAEGGTHDPDELNPTGAAVDAGLPSSRPLAPEISKSETPLDESMFTAPIEAPVVAPVLAPVLASVVSPVVSPVADSGSGQVERELVDATEPNGFYEWRKPRRPLMRRMEAAACIALIASVLAATAYSKLSLNANSAQKAPEQPKAERESHARVQQPEAPKQPQPQEAAAPVQRPLPESIATKLPPPPPLPSPSPESLQVEKVERSRTSPPPAPAAKDKVVLLNTDEPIKQKEDIPSPGKFVLLKTDPKPHPVSRGTPADKE